MAKNKKAPDDEGRDAESDTDALDSEETPRRSDAADAFWEKVDVVPVEIALPKGVGLTLRAYRMSDTFEESEEEESQESSDTETEAAQEESEAKSDEDDAEKDEDDAEKSDDDTGKSDSNDKDDESDDDAENDDDDDEDDEEEDEGPQEVPVFLSADGKLLLFETAAELVKFIKSDAENDLKAIDTWDELVEGIKAEYVVPTEDDSYELDLVVRNLRGGHDTWDPELMVGAGELARDLGYALRVPTVLSTLEVGSPLDDLDNALRSVVDGGIKSMFAKRKVRKVGTQQATLAWRGIINKIGETVDWRN